MIEVTPRDPFGICRERFLAGLNGGPLIYRNSSLAQQLSWNRDDTILAADIVLVFLRGERDLLRLAQMSASTVADLDAFLTRTEGMPLVVDRSSAGQLLIACQETGESLFVTGKTAEVLRAYIDCQPVRGIDRDDMTLRRHASI